MSFSNGRICTQRYGKKQGLEKELYYYQRLPYLMIIFLEEILIY